MIHKCASVESDVDGTVLNERNRDPEEAYICRPIGALTLMTMQYPGRNINGPEQLRRDGYLEKKFDKCQLSGSATLIIIHRLLLSQFKPTEE